MIRTKSSSSGKSLGLNIWVVLMQNRIIPNMSTKRLTLTMTTDITKTKKLLKKMLSSKTIHLTSTKKSMAKTLTKTLKSRYRSRFEVELCFPQNFNNDCSFSDYKPNAQLDRYDNVDIDDVDQEAMQYEDRLKAERAMNQRDRLQQKGNVRMADAFVSDEGEFSETQG